MELLTKSLTIIHVIAGFLALALFWAPIFTRKGGQNHKKIGKFYIRLMWLVVITAFVLSVKNVVFGRYVMGAFLGFLALLTAKPMWLGIEALSNKTTVSKSYRLSELVLNIALTVSGVALIAYGISLGGKGVAALMFVFGALGVFSIVDVIRAITVPAEKVDWLKEHIVGMCVSGIAAHTAFLAFGANRVLANVFSSYWAAVPWVGPTVVGFIGIAVARRRFQSKSRGA